MVHSGRHEVTSTAGGYDIDKGIRVELAPQLRDEVIIHEILQTNGVNITRGQCGYIKHLLHRKYPDDTVHFRISVRS